MNDIIGIPSMELLLVRFVLIYKFLIQYLVQF